LILVRIENFDLFAKKCVKPKTGLNGKKIKEQMARSDIYAAFFTIDF
jgi:hypothetical protein